MKAKEIRDMTQEERHRKLNELQEAIFKLRFQHGTGQLENPKKMGQTKRDIARIITIMNENDKLTSKSTD